MENQKRPQKRTIKIHDNNYEIVASRVDRMKFDHPEWSIINKICSIDDRMIVMKCTIFDGDKRLSTGHSYEIFGQGNINKMSAIENCETSAVGRALAFCGYGSDGEICSAEEMKKQEEERTEIIATKNEISTFFEIVNEYTVPDHILTKINEMKTGKSVVSRESLDGWLKKIYANCRKKEVDNV